MDLQLNITVPEKKINNASSKLNQETAGFKFLSKPKFVGKTIARKRRQNPKIVDEDQPLQSKVLKFSKTQSTSTANTVSSDTSDKNDKHNRSNDTDIRNKSRSGTWISSLFKNNPEVPRVGQRAVKPLFEKVFTGKIFSDLNIHPHSVANLQQNLNLTEMMSVQQQAIPVILQGRDVLIRSQTGSGKTLAYALPIIESLQGIRPKINRHDGIRTVVVVPTRELAVQTYELFLKLVKPFTWVVPGLLSGGQKRKAEKARLRKGLNILIGTPGRINDHLRHTKSLNFAKTGCLILDEADRLLDMGYEKDVAAIVKSIEDHKKASTYDPLGLVKQTFKKKIICDDETVNLKDNASEQDPAAHHPLTNVFLNNQRQTILLSATLTKAVEYLAGLTMVDPVFVDTSEGRTLVADSLKSFVNSKPLFEEKQRKLQDGKEEAGSVEDEISEHLENKRGLQQFSGSMFPELFSKNDLKTNAKLSKSDSDSDSDYEYFKVTKPNPAVLVSKEQGPSIARKAFEEAVKSAMQEDELILPATVNQNFLISPMKLRLVTLCGIIVEHCKINSKNGKMIIFMATLEMVDYHADLLEAVLIGKQSEKVSKPKKTKYSSKEDEDESSSEELSNKFEIDFSIPPESRLVPLDIEIYRLHGSMPHEQRIEVFKQFRSAKAGVLICTDVAARGLDLPHVDLVLQYCAPTSATDYVHRVGRTGRAAHTGAATLLLLPSEADFVRYLEEKRIRLKQADERSSLKALHIIAPSAANSARAAVAVQARLEHTVHSNRKWLSKASKAYTSWVRFYSGYPREVRSYLDPKQLHLGHAAKAFALRDTPATIAKRGKDVPSRPEKLQNRLTVQEDEEKKRPGFPLLKFGGKPRRPYNAQSSMHTASEFDSGLGPPVKKKNKNK